MATFEQYKRSLQSCETLQEIMSYKHHETPNRLDDIDTITAEEWSNISYYLRMPVYVCKDLFYGLYDMMLNFNCKCMRVDKNPSGDGEPGKIHVSVKFSGPVSEKAYAISWFAYVD